MSSRERSFFHERKGTTRYDEHDDVSVDHFSNTSEDPYGLEGAFANIADSIEQANQFIFITGWVFEASMHLPCYGKDLRKGLTLHNQGKLDDAILQYHRLVDNEIDTNGYAAYFLAHAYHKKGELENAEAVLLQALDKHPTHGYLHTLLAKMYVEQGKVALAQKYATHALMINPNDPQNYNVFAAVNRLAGDDVGAEKVYLNALKQDPQNRIALQGLGNIALKAGNYSSAAKFYRRCLWFHPQDTQALLNLANALKNDPAIEASEANLQDINHFYARGLTTLTKKTNYQTLPEYRSAIREYALWVAESNHGDMAIHHDLFRAAFDANPYDPELFLAQVRYARNQGAEGNTDFWRHIITQCEETLVRHPHDSGLLKLRFEALQKVSSDNVKLSNKLIEHLWDPSVAELSKVEVDSLAERYNFLPDSSVVAPSLEATFKMLASDPKNQPLLKSFFDSNPHNITLAMALAEMTVSPLEASSLYARALMDLQYHPTVAEYFDEAQRSELIKEIKSKAAFKAQPTEPSTFIEYMAYARLEKGEDDKFWLEALSQVESILKKHPEANQLYKVRFDIFQLLSSDNVKLANRLVEHLWDPSVAELTKAEVDSLAEEYNFLPGSSVVEPSLEATFKMLANDPKNQLLLKSFFDSNPHNITLAIALAQMSASPVEASSLYARALMDLQYHPTSDENYSDEQKAELIEEIQKKISGLKPKRAEVTTTGDIATLISKAEQCERDNDPIGAVYHYKKAQKAEPTSVEISIRLINSLLEIDSGKNAISVLEEMSNIEGLSDHQIQSLLDATNDVAGATSNKDKCDAIKQKLYQQRSKSFALSDNDFQFKEAMQHYQESLPSLGETLIRKALANPEMVIAINLWQQHNQQFKYPIRELKQIAKDLGLPFPPNLMIRTNRCRGVFRSHHQKYIVMDDGKGNSTGYVGSCDLAKAKFDWADHQILNTIDNDNGLDRHYGRHGAENWRLASSPVKNPDGTYNQDLAVPRNSWREIISRVEGDELCVDLMREFQSRWKTKSGGVFRGTAGSDDDLQLVSRVGSGEDTIETFGSQDNSNMVFRKINEWCNKFKLGNNKKRWNENISKYRELLKNIPGENAAEKLKHEDMHSPVVQQVLKKLYTDAYQYWKLCKLEENRLTKKYPVDHKLYPKVQFARKKTEAAKETYKELVTKHLQVSAEARGQFLDDEPVVDDPTRCKVRVITSTEKAYHTDSNWGLKDSVDTSIRDAYVEAIRSADNFIYIENQYFTCDHHNIDTDPIVQAMLEKIISKANAEPSEPFHIHINLPYSPNGEPGDKLTVDPLRKTQQQVLSYMMEKIEAETGKSWNEYMSVNFFAQWQGVDAARAERLEDGKAITRGESQAISRRAPIYNHAKMMVVDGATVINGSANISKRSMQGNVDTELAIVQTTEGRPEAKRKVENFMLKIIRQYYGSEAADIAQARLDAGEDLGLGSPELLDCIRANTLDNLASFSSNEPGHHSSSEKGLAVSFPYQREFGHPGEIMDDYQFIPDAPRDKDGNPKEVFRWVPEKEMPLHLRIAHFSGGAD